MGNLTQWRRQPPELLFISEESGQFGGELRVALQCRSQIQRLAFLYALQAVKDNLAELLVTLSQVIGKSCHNGPLLALREQLTKFSQPTHK